MSRLRSKWLTPPAGYFYIQDGIKLNGGSYDDTIALIRAHRKSNGIPEGNPEQDFIDFTCARWPDGCAGAASPPPLTTQAASFLNRYSRWALSGYPVVDQVTANARADTCWKCPSNQQVLDGSQPSGCCGKLKARFSAFASNLSNFMTSPALKNRTTPADNELYTCGVCGCPLKGAVWIPSSIYDYSPEEKAKFKSANQKCWKTV